MPDPKTFVINFKALEHGYAVVSRNSVDSDGTGAQVVDPWIAG